MAKMDLEKRHTHSMGSMSSTITSGVPNNFYMQDLYWVLVCLFIGIASAVNFFNLILLRQRMAAYTSGNRAPSMPKNFIFRTQATITALIREISYCSWRPITFKKTAIYFPPFGPCILIGANLIVIITCWFYGYDVENPRQWEKIGYRTGYMACAQIPLIVLLAGKRNIVGAITGCGYERLNWLHRWVARCLLLTTLVHGGFWFANWSRFNYIEVKLKTDLITQYGVGASAVLVWLVFSSISPIRSLSYEFFLIQHIISYLGFLAAVYFHVPAENRKWVYIPFAIWALDRVTRAAVLVYNNLTIFHRNTRSGILTCRATFETVDEHHTRVIIPNPPITWKAGQHVFLSCHALTSHPFSIVSLPSDGCMEFLIRAKKGATKRFFKYAASQHPLPTSMTPSGKAGRAVLIEGPYARIRPLKQFDSLVFLAGSTGTTFTLPLMRDIVRQWMITAGLYTGSHYSEDLLSKVFPVPVGAVTRNIRFVWVLRKSEHIRWFQRHLHDVIADVTRLRSQGKDINVEIDLYVTGEDHLPHDLSNFAATPVSPNQPTSPDWSSNHNRLSASSDLTTASTRKSVSIDPRIIVHYGRPELVTIIRQEAEKALGEMAVVVCGPPGMVRGARSAVSRMSDERGVHKGTGAQGIYVHAEMFGY